MAAPTIRLQRRGNFSSMEVIGGRVFTTVPIRGIQDKILSDVERRLLQTISAYDGVTYKKGTGAK